MDLNLNPVIGLTLNLEFMGDGYRARLFTPHEPLRDIRGAFNKYPEVI